MTKIRLYSAFFPCISFLAAAFKSATNAHIGKCIGTNEKNRNTTEILIGIMENKCNYYYICSVYVNFNFVLYVMFFFFVAVFCVFFIFICASGGAVIVVVGTVARLHLCY